MVRPGALGINAGPDPACEAHRPDCFLRFKHRHKAQATVQVISRPPGATTDIRIPTTQLLVAKTKEQHRQTKPPLPRRNVLSCRSKEALGLQCGQAQPDSARGGDQKAGERAFFQGGTCQGHKDGREPGTGSEGQGWASVRN